MLRLSILSFALAAAMPVYILNGDAVAPAQFTLDASHFGAVVAHFLGSNQLASQEAIDAAQFVPGTFMDERNSNVVVFTDFDQETATDSLGSALFEVTPREEPKFVDVGTPISGDAALSLVKSLDSQDAQTLLLNAKDNQEELLEALASLNSKVMVLGVPSGRAVPVFRTVDKNQKKEHKSRSLTGVFESADECTESTNNCSGHGTCVKSKGGYVCACKATKKSGYTSYWGGSACEKRDVSWQFNLLLWTGVGIIFATIAGVSMLFSIDSEPLPGVLNVQ